MDLLGWLLYLTVGYFSLNLLRNSPWLSLLSTLPYFLLPFLGTILLGYITFANAHAAGPPAAETQQAIDQAPREPLLIHISDTHFLSLHEPHTQDNELRDLPTQTKLIDQIVRLHPRYVLITGDVTDSGTADQWIQAAAALRTLGTTAGITVILVPGNHDLHPTFLGVRGPGLSERFAANLARRFLEHQMTMSAALASIDQTPVASRLSWTPDADELNEAARKIYEACIYSPPLSAQMPVNPSPEGCEALSRKPFVREQLIESHTADACQNWFPLVHYDAEARTSIIVLCSLATFVPSIGGSAIGSFGNAQIKRLGLALAGIPADAKHVLVTLHHPVMRRFADTYSVPHRWWRWGDWENSDLYNYALLRAEWREGNRVTDAILKGMEGRRNTTFTLLYGHRHQRSLSAIAADDNVLTLSEAPALSGVRDRGFRACQPVVGAVQLACQWLCF